MLQLKARDLKELALGPSEKPVAKTSADGVLVIVAPPPRSVLTVVASTALGGGLVYLGAKKGGWWHVATAVGVLNLYRNGSDIACRI